MCGTQKCATCRNKYNPVQIPSERVFASKNQSAGVTESDSSIMDESSGQTVGQPSGNGAAKSSVVKPSVDNWVSYVLLLATVVVTVVSFPRERFSSVTLQKVWYFGWITAVSTGLGVVPFYFIGAPNKSFIGLANGCASGMMAAASVSLMWEGANFNEVSGFFGYHSLFRVVAGFAMGIGFILSTKSVLDKYEDLKFGSIEGAGAQKILLIVFVMTLHSLTEGIGIGVSFGGRSGAQLGQMISLSLALHNVPEGLAVALVLTSRGVPKIRTALWCIFTSLPQPLMAIPAFMFVERFLPILPAGLGFASGAMLYVAVFELFLEAVEDTSVLLASSCAAASFAVMIFAQEAMKMTL